MSVSRFEDLIAWQRSRELAKEIYGVTRIGSFARDFGLRDQVQRAAVSVMSNVAEGFEMRSDGQFRRYLSISRGSCAEVRSILYLASDVGYISAEVFDRAMGKAVEVGRIVSGLQNSSGPSRTYDSQRNTE